MKNVMIFAAGMGTRLKPLTDTMPKALVPVGGKPLLQHVLAKVNMQLGMPNIVVNVHHFASQIIDFLKDKNVKISDESAGLLDTGGGLKKAIPLFSADNPILIHNVDILSNVDLAEFYESARANDATLLVSNRKTQRYLLFDDNMRLVGWTNIATGEVRSPYNDLNVEACKMLAFSGIHCIGKKAAERMAEWGDKFPIMDFYLAECANINIKGIEQTDLKLMDVGKLNTLEEAENFIVQYNI